MATLVIRDIDESENEKKWNGRQYYKHHFMVCYINEYLKVDLNGYKQLPP